MSIKMHGLSSQIAEPSIVMEMKGARLSILMDVGEDKTVEMTISRTQASNLREWLRHVE